MKQIQAFRSIFSHLKSQGELVAPRGLKILELENFEYELEPYVRFMNFDCRNLNIDYIKKEFLWYLAGKKFDTSITEHAKMWKSLVNKDGSINSNYGRYMFGEMHQFDNVVDILSKDRDSRRASIVILSADHLMSDTHDVPCTYALNFRIRKGRLNMTVRMRSQDAVFGMGNDAPCFSFIHEMAYCMLKESYPGLELGNYHHSADSFHIYERHFDMMRSIVNGDRFTEVDCPKMSGAAEVRQLLSLDFTDVPAHHKFTKWLLS